MATWTFTELVLDQSNLDTNSVHGGVDHGSGLNVLDWLASRAAQSLLICCSEVLRAQRAGRHTDARAERESLYLHTLTHARARGARRPCACVVSSSSSASPSCSKRKFILIAIPGTAVLFKYGW